MKISLKVFTVCEMCPADHLKSRKNRGYKGIFLAICNFAFSPSFGVFFTSGDIKQKVS